jgi:hypothetical protein
MRWLTGALVTPLILIAVYVGSAVMSLNGLVDAARAGNGADVLARTDTPRLKRSLVDQIVSAYLKRIGQDRPIKPFERIVANTYGATIADALIGKLLTAENLTTILQKGSLTVLPGAEVNMLPLSELDTSKVLSTIARFHPVKMVEFAIRLGDDSASGAISLHFEGNGWKLSGVELPRPALEALAQTLPDKRRNSG